MKILNTRSNSMEGQNQNPLTNDEGPSELEKKIIEAFEVFDHAGNKTVDVREIGTIIRSLGCVPTEAEIQEIIVSVEDPETSGSVHLDSFLPHVADIISEYKMQPASAEELLKAFQTLDKENKGYLTKEYLTKAMMEEGEPFTQEEIDEMMAIAVDPDSGNINYEYYINQIMID
ncbi:dynein regulatory complex protein 8 [Rhodnius prolixus]|uniref:dynein regulatory complex protein 8 n=1 Tax=Rhodnius prolixus TaxID=13249 RepID=UPI003D1885FF